MPRLTFVVLVILTQTYADYPALKALLSEKGLKDLSQMMSVWIQNKLKSTQIPDVHGKVDIKIGTVHYTLSNIRVQKCTVTDLSLVFVNGTGVSLEVGQISLAIVGRWATKFGIITDSGSFDLLVSKMGISVVLRVGDEAGRLSVSTVSCSNDVEGVDIEFHGGASYIINLFVSSFRGKISGMIREKICPAIQQGVENLETDLQDKPVNLTVDKYIYLSVPLTSCPTVTNQSCELDIKGEFYSNSSPSEPPFTARAFDVQYAEKYMLSLAASEFSVNSAAYAYHSSGVLQINIRDDMIPKSSPLHLNTSQFGAFIPQLLTLYPNMEMRVLLYASETPLVSFTSGLMNAHVPVAAKFSAVKPDGSLVPLFRLDVDSSFSANAQIKNEKLTGAFRMNNLTLTVGSSDIGDFKTDTLEQVLVIAVNTIILPKLNAHLRIGLLLPTLQGFSLINSQLLIKNGFVVIFTDVKD